jgi:predicted small lipoprotein YifL
VRRARPAVALLALLLGACGPERPLELPPLAAFDDDPYRVRYKVLQEQPATIEVRCLLGGGTLLDNPHFDRGAVKLEWAGGEVPPPWLQVVAVGFQTHEYEAWVVPGYRLVASYEQSEEQVGRLDEGQARAFAERAGIPLDGGLRRRRVSRELLAARLVVDWHGPRAGKQTFGKATLHSFPVLDAELRIDIQETNVNTVYLTVQRDALCHSRRGPRS